MPSRRDAAERKTPSRRTRCKGDQMLREKDRRLVAAVAGDVLIDLFRRHEVRIGRILRVAERVKLLVNEPGSGLTAGEIRELGAGVYHGAVDRGPSRDSASARSV